MADDVETTALVNGAAGGDASSVSALLDRHRQRLLRMIACRMDHRLQGRVDPSDILQESLIVAIRRLDDYAATRCVPFYIWLRQIAWEQLVHAHERHLGAQKRSVARENDPGGSLSAWSRGKLAKGLASLTTPSRILMREELRRRVEQQLERLAPHSRDVLVQRYLEQLSVKEIAAILGISSGAAQMRIVRALEQLRTAIDDSLVESDL